MLLLHRIWIAVLRCRKCILVIFGLYWLSCLSGIIMVHAGSGFALAQSDRIVGNAYRTSEISHNYIAGNRFKAAGMDFASNLFSGAVVQTVIGYGIVFPFAFVAYQGWVGGIVSVDHQHKSRLMHPASFFYYFIVLLLQYIPYSLAVGAGLKAGLETYRYNKGRKMFQYAIEPNSFKDILYIYILVVPLFLGASLFEFLSSWNV